MTRNRLGRGPFQILIVEDSSTDRLLTTSALNGAGFPYRLHAVDSGIDALAFLRKEANFSDAPFPDLILLDLNLPKMGGRELLMHIKGDTHLRMIPVVVLTTSESDEDILRAYAGHANSYIAKPVDMHKFARAMRTLGEYWFETVSLPPPPAPEAGGRRFSSSPASTQSPLKILIVEDSETDAVILKRSLGAASSPLIFERAHLLSAAAEKLRSGKFDAVVLDLGLPDSQGLDTLRFLRRLDPTTPIVVLTGIDDEAMGPRALEIGAQDYLVKGELAGSALARSLRYAIERSRVNEQLLESQRLQVIGQISKSVAHDFNNLLTIIANSSGLLKGASPEDAAGLFEEIEFAVRRGSMLTRQLLSMSQQQAQSREEVDLNALVTDFSRFLGVTLGEVELQLELSPEVPAMHGDPADLRQLILNLALNGRDAMPQGGKLTITTSVVDAPMKLGSSPGPGSKRAVRLRIVDQGGGVDPALAERIFEPFFTTKSQKRRPGLGLATVRNIASEHGGVIEVETTPGMGGSFSVFFPIPGGETRSKPSALSKRPASHPAMILVVDDEIAIQRTAARILERDGHQVLIASSGEAALALWQKHGADIKVVVTDLMMPDGMSGKELTEVLRAQGFAAPIVYSSGYSEEFASNELSLVRGTSFIEKPYSPDELRTIVRQALAPRAPEPNQ